MKCFVVVAFVAALVTLSAPAAFAQYIGETAPQTTEDRDVVKDIYSDFEGGWPDAMVGRAQAALRDQGYYNGPVDGYITPQFRQAVWNYQRDRRLPVSGGLDRFTLVSLSETTATWGMASPR